MKVRDVIKLVEADGWYQVKTVGSHRQYKHQIKFGRVTIRATQVMMYIPKHSQAYSSMRKSRNDDTA